MQKSARFWNKIAEKYSKKPIADEEAYQHKLQKTREFFQPGMKVLEFGCGTGGTAISHAPFVKHIQAVDISYKMLDFAKAKAAAANVKNVTFEVASIDQVSLPSQSLDAVLGLNILHLLEDRNTAIAHVYQMLKPGGIFVSSTACLGDTMKFFEIIAPLGRALGLLPILKVFTAKELENSLTDAGFEIEYHWQKAKGKDVFIVAKKLEA